MYEMKGSINKNGHSNAEAMVTGNARKRILYRQSSSFNREEDFELDTLSQFHFPFLQGIKKSEIKDISSRIVFQKYAKKAYVYLPYNNAEKIYFIKHGNVEVGYLDESGRELSIDILGPGEIFGSFMGQHFSGGFARTVDKAILAILNKDDFEEFLERYPRFAFKIFKLMTQRITTLEIKLQNLVFSDVKTRICKLLYSLYEKAGDKKSGQIKISLTHQDIANLVASSRETASLHLSELKKRGTIAYQRKRIRILSLNDLQRFSASC